MITLRKSAERGLTQIDWLKSYHSFSFGEYRDPKHMGFHALRVINDDIIAPGGGFGTHPHRDMEIITVVYDGTLQHKDSLGTGSVIRPGDVQRMSAGTGILHSEFNASDTDPVRLLQIWIIPDKTGIAPGYQQKHFPPELRSGVLRLAASPDGAEDSITIQQDARLYISTLGPKQGVDYHLSKGRSAWVQVATGSLTLNGQSLGEGDGATIENEQTLVIESKDGAELLLFDLA